MKSKSILLLMLLSGCAIGPQQVTPSETVNPSVSSTPDIKVSPSVSIAVSPSVPASDKSPNIQHSSEPSPAPTLSPSISPTPFPSYTPPPDCIKPTPFPTYHNVEGRNPNLRFDQKLPLNVEFREGDTYVSLIFKDPPRVRLIAGTKTFKSLACDTDITNINTLIIDYDIKQVFGSSGVFGKTEEELATQEKYSEIFWGADIPNKASMYTLIGKDLKVKELIEKLRLDPLVLTANDGGNGTGTTP